MTTKETPKFGWRDKIGYAMGDCGILLFFNSEDLVTSAVLFQFSLVSYDLFTV